jgi:hypothetical protein
MKYKQNNYFTIVFCAFFTTLALCFVILAWSEPAEPPPQGSVATPINTSAYPQSKAAAIGFNYNPTGPEISYWIAKNGNSLALKSGNNELTATTRFIIGSNGYVGIDTTAPSAKLHVYDTTGTNGVLNNVLWLTGGGTGKSGPAMVFNDYYGSGGYPTWQLGQMGIAYDNSTSWGGDFHLLLNSGSSAISTTERLTILGSSGNVGINTANPTSVLDVAGTAQLRGAAGGTGLYVNASGTVGVGTIAPASGTSLDVAGNVSASQFCLPDKCCASWQTCF